MNEAFFKYIQGKGWVQAQDGSWHKPRVEKPTLTVPFYTPKVNPSKRIRQSRDKMNALELEWFTICKSTYPEDCQIVSQMIRFRLGNGIWYKPDVLVFGGKIYAYEVKGPHAFRGGFENLKVAASQYSWIKWTLVWKENGQWQEQEVLP